ncbi:MAG: hypothetical protein H0X43_06210 [Nitrosospira sp.]|nr:hypothetical protein [Nitrosospira sp.]
MTLSDYRLDGWRGVISGFVIWAAYFVVIYAYLSVGCEKGLSDAELLGVNTVTLGLVAITMAALGSIGALGWVGFASWRAAARGNSEDEKTTAGTRNRFTGLLMMMTSGLALLSTILVGFPVLLLHPCQ